MVSSAGSGLVHIHGDRYATTARVRCGGDRSATRAVSTADKPSPRDSDGQPGSYWTRATALWELNETTEAELLRNFSAGFLTYTPSGSSWCEDPSVFRNGELMLGIISHESEGVLRIRASEQLLLDQLELPYRLKGEWVGY
jgi:hypothetical protein